MTDRKCLFAWTAPDPKYPEYLNVSLVDGKIVVTLRGPKRAPGELGNDHPFAMSGLGGQVTLPDDQLLALRMALVDAEAAITTAFLSHAP
jgi:hypothetical protein